MRLIRTPRFAFNPNSPLAEGLAFNYHYDGATFVDYSANALAPAKPVGSSLSKQGSTLGIAADFSAGDNNNHRYDLGSVDSNHPVSFSGQGEITIQFWLYNDSSTNSNAFPRVLDKSNGGAGANGYYIQGFEPSFEHDLAFGIASSTAYRAADILIDDEWHLYTLTYDQSGDEVLWYRDGDLFLTDSAGANNVISSSTTNAAIGNWNHSTDRNYHGAILCVRGWNRILSAREIAHTFDPVTRWDLIEPRNPVIIAPSAANDTTINATRDQLTLTEYQATVSLNVTVSASVDNLTVTEHQASVNAGTTVNANTDALTLTEYTASINAATNITTNVDSLTLTTYGATIQTGSDVNISANVDALTLTEFAANVNAATNISANVDALTVTEYQATVDLDTTTEISTSVDALTLTEYPATIIGEAGVDATYVAGAPLYNRYKSEKEKRQERIALGILPPDLPEEQKEAVKEAAVAKEPAKEITKQLKSLEIKSRKTRKELKDLVKQLQAEYEQAYQEIWQALIEEQERLDLINQRNRNAVAVLLMMN